MSPQTDIVEKADTEVALEYLEREICELAANIAAATCRWLVLLAEFDRREGWGMWGCARVPTGSTGAAASAWWLLVSM